MIEAAVTTAEPGAISGTVGAGCSEASSVPGMANSGKRMLRMLWVGTPAIF
jgi:hypothetical protein